MAPGWKQDRIGAAHRGENPMVMARLRSGFAVIGDTQHLPGYSLLLCADASVGHLSDLPLAARADFLLDLALVGEAVEIACRPDGLRRVNLEILGNSLPWLHGHVHARYEWEDPELRGGPVWRYPPEVRNAPEHAYDDARHGALCARITEALGELTERAYR
jgi:diadenosine tetraphosphate (Ap4A) HIT family hydrolase